MQRKLVKQGVRALTITLPSDWLDSHNLKPGNEVNLTQYADSITIYPSPPAKTTLNGSADISKKITNAYINGVNQLIIKNPNINQIKQTVTQLIGFEIIKQSKSEVEILSTSLNYTQQQALNQIFALLRDQSPDINRYTNYYLRLLHKNPNLSSLSRAKWHRFIENLQELATLISPNRLIQKILEEKQKQLQKKPNSFKRLATKISNKKIVELLSYETD